MKSHIIVLLVISMAALGSLSNKESDFNLVGSTPGDTSIKKMLVIKEDVAIDFIRWNVIFKDDQTFQLTIQYGENQPNTLGFKNGGEQKTIEGKYKIVSTENWEELYELKSDNGTVNLNIIAINANLFHILDNKNQLLVGNGGWSYMLNRKQVQAAGPIRIKSKETQIAESKVVFEGRTPCQEIARLHPEMKASAECFKIKWRLILNRDTKTGLPTTCTTRNIVNNKSRDVDGNWEVLNTPMAVIYKLNLPGLKHPILLMQADKNILYFLDEKHNLLIGNKDFSFALNRR